MEYVVTPGNDLYYKAVHRASYPDVFMTRGGTCWCLGVPRTCPESVVLFETGYHACKHPAAPFLDALGYGYKRGEDVLLLVKLDGDVVTDGTFWAASECTPLRVVSDEEWTALVTGESMITSAWGDRHFLQDGALRYNDDLPSTVTKEGICKWVKHGKLHRGGDKPAVVRPDGTMEWWREGVMHRDSDMPAFVSSSKLMWYVDGKLHRDNEKPAVVWDSGKLAFYHHSKLQHYAEDPGYAALCLRAHSHGDAAFLSLSLSAVPLLPVDHTRTRVLSGTLEVTPGNDLYYKAVHKTADSGVYESLKGTTWRLGVPRTCVGPVIVGEAGFHACKHPAAPFLDALGYGYKRGEDVLLLVQLWRHIETDGIVWAASDCMPLRVVPDEEWTALVSGDSELCSARGDRHFLQDGTLRYDDNLPSTVTKEGICKWVKHGKLHRGGDKPAIVGLDGTMEWWREGVMHRDGDMPAFVSSSKLMWYMDGKLHRDDGKPAVVWDSGNLAFYHHSKLQHYAEDPGYAALCLQTHSHGDAAFS